MQNIFNVCNIVFIKYVNIYLIEFKLWKNVNVNSWILKNEYNHTKIEAE